MILDLSARILRHKTAQEQFSKIIGFIQHILNPTNVPLTATGGVNPKKRKNDDNDDDDKKNPKQQKGQEKKDTSKSYTGSSMFVESLGGGGDGSDDSDSDSDKESGVDDQEEKKEEAKTKAKPQQPNKKKTKSGLKWDDPDFDKYYHGEKKPNRMGQRYRRK